MPYFLKTVLAVIALGLICPITPSYALQPLEYSDDVGATKKLKINTFLKNVYNSSKDAFDIALIDLNSDGVEEYILKRKSCASEKKQCFHMIIAEKDSKLLLLSEISAKNLMIAGTVTNGIKDILAFKKEINDYDFDIYMWSPAQKTYIMRND